MSSEGGHWGTNWHGRYQREGKQTVREPKSIGGEELANGERVASREGKNKAA